MVKGAKIHKIAAIYSNFLRLLRLPKFNFAVWRMLWFLAISCKNSMLTLGTWTLRHRGRRVTRGRASRSHRHWSRCCCRTTQLKVRGMCNFLTHPKACGSNLGWADVNTNSFRMLLQQRKLMSDHRLRGVFGSGPWTRPLEMGSWAPLAGTRAGIRTPPEKGRDIRQRYSNLSSFLSFLHLF